MRPPSARTSWAKLVALLLTSSALADCSGESGPTQATPLRIATFNAHNLFDDRPSGMTETEEPAAYAAHLGALASVLSSLTADIVVLQEVEGLAALDDLAVAEQESGGPHHPVRVLVQGNDPRGINLGVLSRWPLDQVVSHRADTFGKGRPGGPFRYARDCLEIHLTYSGRRTVLLAVHFKSKVPPDDPEKRLAEAVHTRTIADDISDLDPAAAILILGDFNDGPESPAVLAVQGEGPNRYADTAASLPGAWTYEHSGQHELLDHQMANPILASTLDRATIQIRHDGSQREASDHAPLAATYDIR